MIEQMARFSSIDGDILDGVIPDPGTIPGVQRRTRPSITLPEFG
jgi:hypothetical protein